MSYISFAWTTPAVLAGAKTVTRRDWTLRHAAQFHAGDVVDAWDKSPRVGGKKVARIRLTTQPVLEPLFLFPKEDFDAEGFTYLAERLLPAEEIKLGDLGLVPGWPQLEGLDVAEWLAELRRLSVERIQARDESLWVVRFELVEVLDGHFEGDACTPPYRTAGAIVAHMPMVDLGDDEAAWAFREAIE